MSISIDTPGAHSGFSFGQYPEEHRKKPLIFTLAVHFFIFISLLIPPDFFQANRNLDEIYTVDLFETVESLPAKQVQPPPPPPKIAKPPKTEPVIAEKVKPATSLQAVETPPGEIISLKPRVLKKDHRTKKISKVNQQKVDNALDRIKKQLNRQEAEQKARQIEARAAAVAESAVDKLRDILHAQQPLTPVGTNMNAAASKGGGKSSSNLDEASKLYFVAVQQQIQAHWILPELQEWKNNLKAVVVVNVRRDGIVTKYFFERKSDNLYFNQFVEKTLKESLPLPPFPQGLKDESIEFGLVFHPGGLQ